MRFAHARSERNDLPLVEATDAWIARTVVLMRGRKGEPPIDEAAAKAAEERAARQERIAEIDHFIQQARWLLDYHDKRSDSVSGRAVALLGFVGVILALVVGARPPADLDVNWIIKCSGIATVAFLLVTALCCVRTITVRPLEAPGVDQLRENWNSSVDARRRGVAALDVAEAFLRGKRLTKPSVINSAMIAADSRAWWFKYASYSMGVSLISLSVLLVALGYQVYF